MLRPSVTPRRVSKVLWFPYSETAAVVERPVCCVQELKGLGQPPEPCTCPDIPMGEGQESS